MGDDKQGDLATAGEKMADDMPSETEAALDRSLAVQGEPEDEGMIGADEEE